MAHRHRFCVRTHPEQGTELCGYQITLGWAKPVRNPSRTCLIKKRVGDDDAGLGGSANGVAAAAAGTVAAGVGLTAGALGASVSRRSGGASNWDLKVAAPALSVCGDMVPCTETSQKVTVQVRVHKCAQLAALLAVGARQKTWYVDAVMRRPIRHLRIPLCSVPSTDWLPM